jgi:decaprenylphospho-beta-D-erythro-pentofuranosid-2-ulose 2-reductase
VIIFGATSAIAHAIGRRYAARGASLVLVGRDRARLEANAADLTVRGAAKAVVVEADLAEITKHRELVDRAADPLGRLDVAIIAHGVLPEQRECDESTLALCHALEVNFSSVASLASALAARLERERNGTLAVLGSVAGDRGRRGNYAYGAAKAGVAVFLEGLGMRVRPHGVRVLTVKPGFVDTPMTARFRKGLLWSTPERVARAVVRAIDRRRTVIYVPWFWRPIMLVVRVLPRAILERLPI